MRVFAGPNGSGKSVLKSYLPEPLLGVYLNPDEIEAEVKERGCVDLGVFGIESSADEVLIVFTGSEFLRNEGFGKVAGRLTFTDEKLGFPPGVMNSYFASVLAGFLRRKLLEHGRTFTFETVMSHPGKAALLQDAQEAGYRTCLYYVATDDPAINVSRVANRVALGGLLSPRIRSWTAIISPLICYFRRFAPPTGPISSTTRRTMPMARTLGWRRSPTGGRWNSRRTGSRRGFSTRCWTRSKVKNC